MGRSVLSGGWLVFVVGCVLDDRTVGTQPAGTGSSSTGVSTSSVDPTSSGSPPDSVTDPTLDPDSGGTTGVVSATTSGESETNNDGCGFICEPDGGNSGVECDIFAQDCPSGQKCLPWASDGGSGWTGTRCTNVSDDPRGLDEPCVVEEAPFSGIDDCDFGLMCFGVDPLDQQGRCFALCEGDEMNPTCDDGVGCTLSGSGVLALCLPLCNPLTPVCPEGDGCFPWADVFMCAPVVDPGEFADPCNAALSDCAAGLYCAPPEAVPGCAGDDGCCNAYCDLAAVEPSAACPGVAAGQECVPWFEPGRSPPGDETLGACVIP
jgi:hypothetical protein